MSHIDDLVARHCPDGVPIVPMGSVGKFFRGRRFTKKDVVEDGIESIHYGEIYTGYGVSAERSISHVDPNLRSTLRFAKPGDVVIAAVGETVEDVGKAVAWLGEDEVAIHDDCFAFRHTLEPKFVAYYFQTDALHRAKAQHVARAKVKRISGASLAKLPIPVPPVAIQRETVRILDQFSQLEAELAAELEAELKARRLQYEHYRDRLLTFQEAG